MILEYNVVWYIIQWTNKTVTTLWSWLISNTILFNLIFDVDQVNSWISLVGTSKKVKWINKSIKINLKKYWKLLHTSNHHQQHVVRLARISLTLSLSTSPYHSSPLAGLQSYIPYHHIATVCMFELVVLLLIGHMRGFTGVHHLWARPYFSSRVRYVWFV